MEAISEMRRSILTDAISVLIVDENPTFLRITSRLLREYHADDVTVLGISHGSTDALDLARRLKPRVVLLGVIRSDAATQRLITRIRAILPDVTIILLGADNSPEARQSATASGADAFVAKNMVDEQLFPVLWHTAQAPVAPHRVPMPQWQLAPVLDFTPTF
jgi:CheY-like chemotaxis protein